MCALQEMQTPEYRYEQFALFCTYVYVQLECMQSLIDFYKGNANTTFKSQVQFVDVCNL